jgi:hypothetical protein
MRLPLLIFSTRLIGDVQLVLAQQPPSNQQPTQQPPRIEERVEVVGITPIHGIGLARTKVPSNVQVFTADQLRSSTAADVPTLLTDRAASVPCRSGRRTASLTHESGWRDFSPSTIRRLFGDVA